MIHLAKADGGTITINADGSITPSTAPITTVDNITYAFTANIINESIVVERDSIVLDGQGYTVQGTGNGTGITLSGRSNVTIKNTKITTFEYGIELDSSSNSTLSGNNITANNGNGILLSYSSKYNSISGNNITNNGGGIGLVDSSNDNSVSGNNITANNGYGIWLASVSCYNTISGNNIANNKDGIWLYLSFNCRISGNNITNNGNGILLNASSSNNSISDNNITANNYDGIGLDSSSGNTLSGNNVTANTNYGILLNSSSNNVLSGNKVANNAIGIVLNSSCSNNVLSSNNITNNLSGIALGYSSNNTLSGNTVTANTNYGIALAWSSSNNTLSDNNVSANSYHGIWLSYSCDNNNLSGNNIANNSVGIGFDFSSDSNTLSGNTVTANSHYGIYLRSSSNNFISHNNFVNNTNQVITEFSANVWDDGYPSGGNFWSDYNGTDSDQDGIGDAAYVIDANNTDNYPLMGMFYEFTVTDGMLYNIATVSNFTILDLYSLHELRIDGSWYLVLEFTAVIPKGTVGFCRVDIPRVLIDGPYHVFTLGGNFTPTELPISNSSHALLYFTFDHSGPVIIVPEFPSFLILPLFFIATLFAAIIYRRKHPQNE